MILVFTVTPCNSHAPRERVSWNGKPVQPWCYRLRHAPRERVSWNRKINFWFQVSSRHAPRERVSWNGKPVQPWCYRLVTLHVSVWVEMPRIRLRIVPHIVTLHVSVWVEMFKQSLSNSNVSSRSTWACELKFNSSTAYSSYPKSRSTWACELKFLKKRTSRLQNSHAPRERVSWNFFHLAQMKLHHVTLHVSVWVEILQDGETAF